MKTSSVILLISALTLTWIAATDIPTQKPKQILFDFRLARKSAPLGISPGSQRALLSKIFRKYLTDQGKCNPRFDAGSSMDPLQTARNAGQIVPSIVDMATGSFTAPNRQETVYVISVSECNASHADNFGTKRIAIFSGQQLIANTDLDFKSGIVSKTDLNGDGLNELLMTSGDMNQGTLIEMAALLEFQNARLRVIEDFGTVFEDSCASLLPGSSSKASVVSILDVVPGKMPRLHVDNYESSSRKVKRWRFVSTGKMQD